MNDAVDGELSPLKRLLFKLHVALCAPCRKRHNALCNTMSALRILRDCPPVMDDDAKS